MRQAWHIFKKDARYLRYEIAFLLLLAAVFCCYGTLGLRNGSTSDALCLIMVIAADMTIARLIHAEPIPGENQFWVTRPYRWQSLLTAKILFILSFINLPVLLAQAGALLITGFPIAVIVPGLLWTQVLILFCVLLPMAVIASLTHNLTTFVSSLLAITLVAFALLYRAVMTDPAQMEWLRDSIVFVTLAVLAPSILYLQYKTRKTQLSRVLAIGITTCGACIYGFIAWQTLFPLQARLSKQTSDVQITQRVRSSYDPQGRFELWLANDQLNLSLPLEISGVPDGIRSQVESFSIELAAPDGRAVQFSNTSLSKAMMYTPPLGLRISDERKWNIHAQRYLPRGPFLIMEHGQPLTLHATFYLTLYGNARDRTITLRKAPADVMDGLQCYAGYLNQLECRSAFRWPARIVSQKSGSGVTPLTTLISYSPFPAGLDLDPIVRTGMFYESREALPEDRPVTIEITEPLAYLRRDVEVHNLHLGVK